MNLCFIGWRDLENKEIIAESRLIDVNHLGFRAVLGESGRVRLDV